MPITIDQENTDALGLTETEDRGGNRNRCGFPPNFSAAYANIA